MSQTAYKKSSFGPAFLFLDKSRRQALAQYYAFCRLMDDIADEPEITDKDKQLQFWSEEIDRVFTQHATTDLGKELENMVRTFAISKDRFTLLIDGMRADVQAKTYHTLEELEWYLWRVAGIVGQATLDILGIKGPKADKLAHALGFAVQLTNIIRDVWEDAQLGRVYIPQQLLQKYHVTPQDILQHTGTVCLPAVLKQLAQLAQQYYEQADQIMQTLPARKMLPCRVMSLVYRQNLAKIEKAGFQFTQTIKLTKQEKIRACFYALYKSIINC